VLQPATMSRRDDDLAYGDYHGQQGGEEGERGLVGDMGRRFFGGKKEVRASPLSTVLSWMSCMSSGFRLARGV
jgi:hypothetical protein